MIEADLLAASDERFRLLVDGVTEYAIFMLDPVGAVVTWNAGARRIKGYTEEEILGRHFSVFFVNDDVSDGKPQRLLADAVAAGRVNDEGWRVRKDGSRFWANVVITALTDDQGLLRGFAKVTRDDTDRREAIRERVRREMLEVREGIGHELQHDVVQRLFGVGLLLSGVQQFKVQPELSARLAEAVDELDAIVRHIRTTLWEASARSATDNAVIPEGDDRVLDAVGTLDLLVVEDDPDLRALLAVMLAAVGTVHVVPDAYQALAWLDSEPVDVMVLDLMLPGIDGVGLLHRARQRGRNVPTVVVTGMRSTDGLASAAIDAGAAVVLTKPFDAGRLRDSVVRAALAATA